MLRNAGKVFRKLVNKAKQQGSPVMHPIQVMGTVNAYCGMLAQKAGAEAIYLSGSGVATASYGLPDLGITSLDNVLEDAKRITSAVNLPLLVDVDTGFGSAFGIYRTVRELERVGVAAIHIEDQEAAKRCGHRPNKKIVSVEEMSDRIKAAVDGKTDKEFVVMARTDALATEGLHGAIKRCEEYVKAGADMLFPEAFTKLEEYEALHKALPHVPLLANITEFGKTPLYNVKQLGRAGVSMVLYPLSAHRAMAKAAEKVYKTILAEGCQDSLLDTMQTREELYGVLDYYKYEQTLDRLFGAENNNNNNNKKKKNKD